MDTEKMDKIVLILGAGASQDYGYPSWDDLKDQMINLPIDEFLDNIEGLSDTDRLSHKEAHEEFLSIHQRNKSYTLDRIVYEIDKEPISKHFSPTGHYLINIAGYLLAKKEVDKSTEGWVTEFQKILIDYILTKYQKKDSQQNVFESITIISLNYDRVFEHFISDRFYKKLSDDPRYKPKDYLYSTNLARKSKLKIIKPHGYICSLKNNNSPDGIGGMNEDLILDGNLTTGIRYPGNEKPIAYGDNRILSKEYFLRMGRHMYVVDERDQTDYQRANAALKSAQAVFCLGLSSGGICQSSLSFQSDQKVYLTNMASEVSEIEACKSGPVYESLGTDDKFLSAKMFPSEFSRIVFGNEQ